MRHMPNRIHSAERKGQAMTYSEMVNKKMWIFRSPTRLPDGSLVAHSRTEDGDKRTCWYSADRWVKKVRIVSGGEEHYFRSTGKTMRRVSREDFYSV